jgi:hypothetical protein
MSATNQPHWRLVAQLGDVDCLRFGAYWVFEDTTGVYPPEAEHWEVPEDDDGVYEVSRVILDRCSYTDAQGATMHPMFTGGVLSDNKFHPEHEAWFAKELFQVAECCGYKGPVTQYQQPIAELRADLCSSKAINRACAYRALAEYHGWVNFDEYPLRLTHTEIAAREKAHKEKR